jgi:sulfide:quinone oxidoreductase
LDKRVIFHVDPAVNIDVDKEEVTTQSGKVYNYDYLVLATGSRIMPQNIPGMTEGANWFYDLDGARKMRKALNEFEGGRIIVNANAPHKCPVAPLEITFMLHDYLKEKGLRDKTEITYTYPIGRLHALEPVANWVVPEFERLGIKSETFFNTKEVDPNNKTITSEEGATLPYDLLVTIPPHQGAEVIENSGLGKGGWVPTNTKTLHREGSNNVFVVGDTTNIPISKAGSTAHFEADTLIDNLVSLISEGSMARDYDGKVFCFVETGMKTGTYVWFNYTTPPNPGPQSQMVHWSKLIYNRLYWLSAKGLL